MLKIPLLMLVLFSAPRLVMAGDESIPTRRILPEDVMQGSVHQWRMGTNAYAVHWIYTEEGARKMLAFHEAHEGQKVRTIIGKFEPSPALIAKFQPMPPAFTNYAQWKEGWLKHRTDKFIGVSADDARKIVEGLKSQ